MQNDHHNSLHYRVERIMRHHIMLGVVVGAMALAVVTFVKREDLAIHRFYQEGFSWVSTHMHHEHPTHGMSHVRISKLPTSSGGWA